MNNKLMTKLMLVVAVAFSAFACQQAGKDQPVKLASQNDSLSYSYGVMIAKQFSNIEGLNPEVVSAGVREAMQEKGQLTTEQANDVLTYEKKKTGS